MKTIFIAGPFRGTTPWVIENNIRKAEGEALEVTRLGAVPVCPHTMYRFFQDSLPDEFWLAATIELLKLCSAIYMIEGWYGSAGSRAEYEFAKSNKIPAFFALEGVKDFLKSNQKNIDSDENNE